MDQPTPDHPTPEATPAPESGPNPTSEPAAASIPTETPVPTPTGGIDAPSAHEGRIEARLQRLAGHDEPIVAWARGWVSRETHLHRVLAARTLDFIVLTDRFLILFSTGFFTRRPRRRVYSSRLERLMIADDEVPRGRRLRVISKQAHPLWIELPDNDRATALADALIERGRHPEAP